MELKSNLLKNLIDKFKENELLRKGSSAVLFKIIGAILGYVFLLLVTRKTGAEGWGAFTLCLALLNLVSIISRFGIDLTLLRYIAQFVKEVKKVRDLFIKGIFLVFLFSIFSSFALYQFADTIALHLFKNSNLVPMFKITALAITPFSLSIVIAQGLRGLKEIKHFVFLTQPGRYFFAIIFFFIFSFTSTVEHHNIPIYSFVLGMFFLLFFALYIMYRKVSGFKYLKFSISKKRILKTATPMLFISSLYLLITNIDAIMIGAYLDEANVGIYNVAVRITGIITFGLAAISSIAAPKFSETYNNNDKAGFKKVVHQSTRLIFICSFPLIILLILFNEPILMLFGEEFIAGSDVLYILLLAQVTNTLADH